jgi:hypothetical protein
VRYSVASKIGFPLGPETSFQPIGQSISPTEFARDVHTGLLKEGQKELYSYDEAGSALFEANRKQSAKFNRSY